MKKILILLIALFSVNCYSQNLGIGFRLGDPSGLTFKKYMGDKAIELSIGRTYIFEGSRWYNNRFDNWYKKKYNYKEFDYLGFYRVTAPLGLQVHYLFQKPINGTSSDVGILDWYLGFGGQLRYQSYSFDYRYKVSGDPNWYYVNRERVSDLDLGVDGVVGLEYKFSKVPIAAFLDFTLSMEIFNDPFIFWGQGGIGARYNF